MTPYTSIIIEYSRITSSICRCYGFLILMQRYFEKKLSKEYRLLCHRIKNTYIKAEFLFLENKIMNHKEILKKHMWDRVDVDKAYWYQCTDWVRMYSLYRWRYITTRGNAIYLWDKWLGSNWKKVVKTPLNYPLEWDLVFWGTTWGKWYWHVAIANKFCNPMVLRTTDQNAGTGNWDWLGKNAINPFFRSYSGVVWWFRFEP